jgi:hypothetical protein
LRIRRFPRCRTREPRAVDRKGVVGRVLKETEEATGDGIIDGDLPGAELADEEIVAVDPEVARSHGEAPGSIQKASMLQAAEEEARGRKDIHVAESGAIHVVVAG